MNAQSIIERLVSNKGVEAVLILGEYKSRDEAAPAEVSVYVLERARSIAESILGNVRMVVGQYTIVVQYHGDLPVVVAIPTGHCVAKSLRRMIVRATRGSGRRKARTDAE